jgi:phage shock protein A
MNESMGRFVGDYARGQQRAYQDQTQVNQQYDLQQSNSDQWRQQALQAIETQKANDVAWTAQNIKDLQQQLGSV